MTKKNFSDMCLYKLAGGIPDANFPVDERDIWDSLDHKVNELFKLRHLDTTLPSGETLPENAMIATYEDNTVVSDGERSYALLPATPISLVKNMGIYLVYDPNYPDMPFIPLQKGQTALLKTDRLLSDIMGQISYEPKNNRITFNKDLTVLGIDVVTMELCIFDISNYSITQELPIPADYIGKLEDEIISEFAPVLSESGIVNPWTTAGQTVPNNGQPNNKR